MLLVAFEKSKEQEPEGRKYRRNNTEFYLSCMLGCLSCNILSTTRTEKKLLYYYYSYLTIW
jgi:hypothetical protein